MNRKLIRTSLTAGALSLALLTACSPSTVPGASVPAPSTPTVTIVSTPPKSTATATVTATATATVTATPVAPVSSTDAAGRAELIAQSEKSINATIVAAAVASEFPNTQGTKDATDAQGIAGDEFARVSNLYGSRNQDVLMAHAAVLLKILAVSADGSFSDDDWSAIGTTLATDYIPVTGYVFDEDAMTEAVLSFAY